LHNFQPAAARLGRPLQEVFKNGALIAESQFKPGFILGPGCALVEAAKK